MNGTKRTGAGLFLMELLLGLGIFAFAAAVCVRVFAGSVAQAQQSGQYGVAVTLAQNAAEACKNGTPAETLPVNYNETGEPSDAGVYTLEVSVTQADGLCDATATVRNQAGTMLYALDFTYEEAVQ